MQEDEESGSEDSGSEESSWKKKKEDEKALRKAAEEGNTDRVKRLLAERVNPNAANYLQASPLHRAARNGHHETVSVLLTAGADVNARNYEQYSPLYWAARNGHHKTVSVLLTAGADVNARNELQYSPLHRTAFYGHHKTVSVLLTAGADVNARKYWEVTPLHDAATRGHPKFAEILLQHGADIGLRNEDGQTAEDIAADEDTRDADPDDEDDEDRIIRGRKEILKLLRQQNYEVSTRKKEYDPVLVRFYEERGMTEAKKDHPLIQEAAKESRKTVDQVMNFIGNYRKSKGGSKRRPPPDTMERRRRITGYHEYYREQLPRKRANRGFSLAGANKEIGESWKNLTDEKKEGYNKAAERRRGKETKVKTSSEVAKKLKQLEKLSEELGDLGVEALMVTLYNGRIRAFGSQKDLIKDEKFGGYIENQLKAAEHQRKAAQCLTMDRRRRSSNREGTTGTTGESHDVTGRPGSSTSSTRKRSKKTKEVQQGKQQHSSSTASLPSASSTQQETTVTTEGRLPRTTDIPQSTPVHVVSPHRATSTPARPNTGNLELLAQQSATLIDLHNSLHASPHNTGTPVHLVPQTTPTESQTGFRYLYRSNMPLELLVPQTTQTAFAVRQVPTGVDNFNSFGLPDRTASLSLPAALSTSQHMQGTPAMTTGELPHTAQQIPTAASLGTSVPSQVTPTVRQAPTGVGTTNEQFPPSPLVFAMPHHR